jgi:hypothetical protein
MIAPGEAAEVAARPVVVDTRLEDLRLLPRAVDKFRLKRTREAAAGEVNVLRQRW